MVNKIKYNDVKDFNDLIERVSFIHKELFKGSTYKSQLDKFSEEYREYIEVVGEKDKNNYGVTDHELEEAADCFIVGCGILLFNFDVGYCLCRYFINIYNNCRDGDNFKKAIIDKMNRNIDRKWSNIENGYYKHIEGE